MGGKVVQGSITDGKLSIEYGEGWETYLHHKEYPEFKEMVNILTAKFKKGRKGERKSGGKFKAKFKGKLDDKYEIPPIKSSFTTPR